ncbi:hypothetical protein AB0467_12415 [Streptomyces sp. NPDC052095]|uniref:hypothetical protein n=1 Tax=unclassified Streptomyces TaxID=2593676 RepID=UPI00344C3CCD
MTTTAGTPTGRAARTAYAQGTYNSALSNRIHYAIRHLDDDQRAEVSGTYVSGFIQPVTDLMARAVTTGELRGADPGFLATAFMELAATVHPPQDDCPPASADRLAQDVVDLFLRGAGPETP